MTAQHTPGPWRYDYAPGYCGELLAPNGTTLAEFVTEPSEADARLIAAAPELLEALNAMLTHMGMDEDEWNKVTFDQARAAIAKANGGGV